ncbi:hypothetical protein [Corynebacterium sp. A21]|uniref:hypothetical protein n=1 Tax=Corynebacterium sp. A21 TaxID=3457318 RepID=UPI003FD0079D
MDKTTSAEAWDNPKRWSAPIPHKPRISRERRHELARQWLEFLGCEVTQQRVEELARVVMRYHLLSPKGQCANELVLAGITPYREAVEKEFPKWQQRVLERNQEQGRHFLTRPEAVEKIREIISSYRSVHGVGPLWREVGYEIGLDNNALEVVLEELKSQGQVTFTLENRSLDVT